MKQGEAATAKIEDTEGGEKNKRGGGGGAAEKNSEAEGELPKGRAA